jgi:DNA-binding transcriptional regulator YhcF (GntR family)
MQASHNGSSAPKQQRDQLAVAIEAWLGRVKRLKLPNGRPLPGNAYKVAEDIGRNPERGFNRKIFEQTGQLEAWPAITTIATATGLNRRTIERMLAVLRRAGCLEIDSGRGRHNRNYFRALQNATALSHFCEPQKARKCDSPVVENATALSHENTTAVSHNLSEKRPVDLTAEKQDRSTDVSASPNAHDFDVEATSLVTYSNEFVMFWRIHPRPKHKDAAFAAFNAALDRGTSVETIMAGVRRFRDACAAGMYGERMRWPLPDTWLDDSRWEDGDYGVVVHLRPESITIAQPAIDQPLAQPINVDNVVPIDAIGRSRRRVRQR